MKYFETDEYKETQARYYANRKAKVARMALEATEAFKRAEKRRQHSRDRQERQRNAPGRHSDAEFNLLVWIYQNRCAYCFEKFEKLTRDHVIPLNAEGSSHDIENILPACQHCNSKKSDMVL